jgi:hypothetical protein
MQVTGIYNGTGNYEIKFGNQNLFQNGIIVVYLASMIRRILTWPLSLLTTISGR